VGEISKLLFGTLDENDAEFYDERIRQFESNSEDTTELLKQQVSVFKSTLGALNITLADVAYNDKVVRDGLTDIQTYLDSLSSEMTRKLSIFEVFRLVFSRETHYSGKRCPYSVTKECRFVAG